MGIDRWCTCGESRIKVGAPLEGDGAMCFQAGVQPDELR